MKSNKFVLTSNSPEQTRQIGIAIGELAQSGDLILLTGDLGVGKTCLTQGIALGIGFDGYVSSPSFILVREYKAKFNIYHIDFYRLDDTGEIDELGLDDYLSEDSICIIEWAEKAIDYLPQEYLLIEFDYLAENQRRLSFKPQGQKYIERVAQLKEKWNSQ